MPKDMAAEEVKLHLAATTFGKKADGSNAEAARQSAQTPIRKKRVTLGDLDRKLSPYMV